MKHSWKITAVLLIMFIVTQLIGLAVINAYIPVKETVIIDGEEQNRTINPLPYGMEPPEVKPQVSLISIIIAFVLAILLILLLTRIKAALFLRIWFFIVVILAISITLNSLFLKFDTSYATLIAALIALPLAFFKIFKRNLLVHNITELMIYPGIAAVFVPILNIWTIIVLLILISAYDIYAVWHSKFMQNMAKFQINELKFFAGFFVPYTSKKEREKIKFLKQKYKNKVPEKVLKKQRIKFSLAILGGGDVIFPIIAAGIFLKSFGLISALLVTTGAVVALAALFMVARKGKFYPAMPFLTAGIFVGMLLGWLVSLI